MGKFILSNGKFVKHGAGFCIGKKVIPPTPTGNVWKLNETLTVTENKIFRDLDFNFNYIDSDGATTWQEQKNCNLLSLDAGQGITNICSFNTEGFYQGTYNQPNAFYTGNYSVYKVAGRVPEVGDVVITLDATTIDAVKTITFNKAPTGELLTWLQANATQQ